VNRGDIYWATLDPRSGSEQRGRRPVVILSHDAFNQTPGWRSIIVVPVSTSNSQARRGPTVVLLSAGTAGLVNDSCVLCHQITTLDRGKCSERIGSLPQETLSRIENALMAAVGIRR
jgi:mRNA interferase MazF